MQKANHILQAIRKLGEKAVPLTRVYRSLYSEDLYLMAYNKIYRNQGALTPGPDKHDTIDGMSMDVIRKLISFLRHEQFYFRPARGKSIPKKSGGFRKLGMPNYTDKLVQETVRLLLEAYYEPRFRDSSHGFRPGRGCHTALRRIKQKFTGATWFIEGDIKGCFDNIDHSILLEILSRDVQDGRLLELIRRGLTAGLVDEWEYRKSHSGTPQGGILSPILSNIYLNELDKYVEDVLIPEYTRGKRRRPNPIYKRLTRQIKKAREQEDWEQVKRLERERREQPQGDPYDPNYRRLQYCRYADDFVLSFIGPKSEAEEIKQKLHIFLQEKLRLQLNLNKTLITHARQEKATFLGYTVHIAINNDKLKDGKWGRGNGRTINGTVRLGVPPEAVNERTKRYMQNGKTRSEPVLLFNSDAHIIDVFQQRYRGLAEYYKYADNRASLNKLRYIMEQSLVKTLAHKFKISVHQVYAQYRKTINIDGKPYRVLVVEVPTKKGTRQVYWGGISLRVERNIKEPINDIPYQEQWTRRSDLIQRLQANTCELCGSQEQIEVHHVRKLADLKQKWAKRNTNPPLWVKRMAAMHRKTLIVCKKCHQDIHAGRPIPKTRE